MITTIILLIFAAFLIAVILLLLGVGIGVALEIAPIVLIVYLAIRIIEKMINKKS